MGKQEVLIEKEIEAAGEDENEIEKVVIKINKKADEMIKKAEAEVDEYVKGTKSNLSNTITFAKRNIRNRVSMWRMKTRYTSYRRRWAIRMRKISTKVGTALNEAKDDVEVKVALDKAKEETLKIESNIKSSTEKFIKTELVAVEMLPERKVEFETMVKAAGDEVKQQIKGVKIFSAIAELKVNANKQLKDMKDKMTKVLIKTKDVKVVDKSLKDLDEKVKVIADELKVKIQVQVDEGKKLTSE